MANWASIAWSSVNGGRAFETYDIMTQDMIRTHLQLRDHKEYGQLRTPILRVTGGTPYTPQIIRDSILTLLALDIYSFVVAESSTYCLQLLQQLLDIDKVYTDLPVSLSISESYHKDITTKWNDRQQINGVVVKMTLRKVKGALPADVIQ